MRTRAFSSSGLSPSPKRCGSPDGHVCPERKSIEPIALLVGHGDVSGLQKFVGAASWAYDDVMAEAQTLFS